MYFALMNVAGCRYADGEPSVYLTVFSSVDEWNMKRDRHFTVDAEIRLMIRTTAFRAASIITQMSPFFFCSRL